VVRRSRGHRQSRDPQLLLAGGIKLGKFGDRRHLAQEAQSVEAPLINRARRPRELRGPADLAFDLADELNDLCLHSLDLHTQDLDLQSPHTIILLRVSCARPEHRERGRRAGGVDDKFTTS
jgi:hypothetical protein